MSKQDKLLAKVLDGSADANFEFADVAYLLQKLGYEMRRGKGSHLTFQRGSSFLNLQSSGAKAKAYLVRQVRDELKAHGF